MSQPIVSYPSYLDSSVDWLGLLPTQWELVPLKYMVKFSGGGTPSRDVPAYWRGNIPWVSPKDMKVSSISGTEEYLTEAGLINSTSNLVDPGALLLVVRSGILKHTIPNAINIVPVSLNQDMKAIRADAHRLSVQYLQYVVTGKNDELLFEWSKQGATVESLEQEYLENTLFPLPTLQEQQKIANFLDHETAKIDTLIEKQQQLINLLKEKRQAVISHAVTKGLNPDAPMKDSGVEWLGEVPEGWVVTEIRYVTTQLGGGTPSKENSSYWEGSIPWVSPKDMKVTKISKTIDNISSDAVSESSVKLVPVGSILIVVRGMILVHSVPVAMNEVPVTINQDMKAFVPRVSLDNEFFLFLLMGLRDKILDFVESSAHGTKCVRTDDLEKMKIFLPPLRTQIEIVKNLEQEILALDSLVNKSMSATSLLQERRTALISAAVTGKIDVRNWQPPRPQSTTSKDV